jgi:HEAT repeat protein
MSFLDRIRGTPDFDKLVMEGEATVAGARKALAGIAKALEHKESAIRHAALVALKELAGKWQGFTNQAFLLPLFLGPLIGSMTDPDEFVRETAAEIVKSIATSGGEAVQMLSQHRALETLLIALKDSSPTTRGCAAETLGYLGDTRAVEPLIQALAEFPDDKYWEARQCAATALGMLRDQRAVAPLVAALREESWIMRRNSARALGMIGALAKESAPELRRVMTEEKELPEVRHEAKSALAIIEHQ